MTEEATTPDAVASSTPPPAAVVAAPQRRSSATLIVALVLVAFIGGMVLSLFGPQIAERWLPAKEAVTTPAPTASVASPVVAPQDVTTLEGRIAALSARLDGLATQAQNAGAFASRAEALMVAFAARRALDNGAPLGYLEGELRARFGEAQPKAVATIISAAQEPVTLSDLQAGLEDSAPALIGTQSSGDWWTATRRELTNLVIIRRAGTPSRVPQRALEQARTLLMSGRVEAALAEVERLPGSTRVEGWREKARRYNEARRALDIIEAAAILEPRLVPGPTAPGDAVATRAEPDAGNASEARPPALPPAPATPTR